MKVCQIPQTLLKTYFLIKHIVIFMCKMQEQLRLINI